MERVWMVLQSPLPLAPYRGGCDRLKPLWDSCITSSPLELDQVLNLRIGPRPCRNVIYNTNILTPAPST